MLADIVPVNPIYSRFSIAAVRKGWDGLVTSEVSTADNSWSLLNMTPADGQMRPLYWTLSDEPRSLNPLSGSSAYDWQVLGLIYDSPLTVNPYDLSDLPSLAENWKVETVSVEGKPVTRLTFFFRPGLTWHDGVPLTADDFRYTLLFLKEHEVPRFFDSVRDIVSVELPDPMTAVITLDNVSYWHLHNVGGMMVLPKHVLEKVADWRSWQPSRTPLEGHPGLTQLVGSGPFVFREYRPGEFVRFTRFDGYWMLER
jgi:peptide/nickel transport system substrate-binding protein